MMAHDTLGKRLKSAREKKGIKQNHAAKQIGVAPSTLAGYESDFRDPDTDTLKKLADIYDVTVDFLLTGRNGAPIGQATELTPEELAKLEKLKHEEVAFKDFLEDPIEAQREFLQAYELFKEMKKKRDQGK